VLGCVDTAYGQLMLVQQRFRAPHPCSLFRLSRFFVCLSVVQQRFRAPHPCSCFCFACLVSSSACLSSSSSFAPHIRALVFVRPSRFFVCLSARPSACLPSCRLPCHQSRGWAQARRAAGDGGGCRASARARGLRSSGALGRQLAAQGPRWDGRLLVLHHVTQHASHSEARSQCLS
jgi:hypothetical protein